MLFGTNCLLIDACFFCYSNPWFGLQVEEIFCNVNLQEQRRSQALEYGTCLHTKEQFDKRSKEDGSAPCETKFKFIPNAGYSFTVSKGSFHSASAGNHGLRRTIMLNWYNTVWKNWYQHRCCERCIIYLLIWMIVIYYYNIFKYSNFMFRWSRLAWAITLP